MIWSSYQPEDQGVFIAYASIHGYSEQAAKELAEMIKKHKLRLLLVIYQELIRLKQLRMHLDIAILFL